MFLFLFLPSYLFISIYLFSWSRSLSSWILLGSSRASSIRAPRKIRNARVARRCSTGRNSHPALSQNDARVVAIIGWPCTLFYGPGVRNGRELNLFNGTRSYGERRAKNVLYARLRPREIRNLSWRETISMSDFMIDVMNILGTMWWLWRLLKMWRSTGRQQSWR